MQRLSNSKMDLRNFTVSWKVGFAMADILFNNYFY